MTLLKKFLVAVCLFLFSISLSFAIFSLALSRTIGSPEVVKDAVQESGFYENVVDEALRQSADMEVTPGAAGVPLDNPNVRQAAQEAFSTDFLAEQGDDVIDSFYVWLRGDTPQPEFTIDVEAAKLAFAHNVGDYLEQRLLGLPACTSVEQLQGQTDPFTIECLPPGFNVSAEKDRFVQQIIESEEFLPSGTITQDDFVQGEGAFEGASHIPAAYRLMLWSPWIFAAVSVLLIVVIVLLADQKWRAIRRIGAIMISTGILLGISTALFAHLFRQQNFGINDAPLQTALVDALTEIVKQGSQVVIAASILTALAGFVVWIVARQRASHSK
jgi:uncharacterized membrane protein YozB (DUF420 family)